MSESQEKEYGAGYLTWKEARNKEQTENQELKQNILYWIKLDENYSK